MPYLTLQRGKRIDLIFIRLHNSLRHMISNDFETGPDLIIYVSGMYRNSK